MVKENISKLVGNAAEITKEIMKFYKKKINQLKQDTQEAVATSRKGRGGQKKGGSKKNQLSILQD